MPRPPRSDYADVVYHVINRSNARAQIFNTEQDYLAFEILLEKAKEHCDIRILSYCIMPNHWHLLLQPNNDGDLSKFMGWLTMTHTQRWHVAHNSVGTGHLYQGRYKSFPVQTDGYFLTVCRYIERNPLRARLVLRAQDWKWGSLWRREYGTPEQRLLLAAWQTEKPNDYLTWVNDSEAEEDITRLRLCVNRGQPFGSDTWINEVAKKWRLQCTLRSEGRPRNKNCS